MPIGDIVKPKPKKMWGLFNFNIFWEAGRTRRDCQEHAERLLGKDFEKYIRDGSLRIAKIVVREGWPG